MQGMLLTSVQPKGVLQLDPHHADIMKHAVNAPGPPPDQNHTRFIRLDDERVELQWDDLFALPATNRQPRFYSREFEAK